MIFRYSKNNKLSSFIVIIISIPDYFLLVERIGRKHPRIDFLRYIRDMVMVDDNIRVLTVIPQCIKSEVSFSNLWSGVIFTGREWLEENMKDGYKIIYYHEVHCL